MILENSVFHWEKAIGASFERNMEEMKIKFFSG